MEVTCNIAHMGLILKHFRHPAANNSVMNQVYSIPMYKSRNSSFAELFVWALVAWEFSVEISMYHSNASFYLSCSYSS